MRKLALLMILVGCGPTIVEIDPDDDPDGLDTDVEDTDVEDTGEDEIEPLDCGNSPLGCIRWTGPGDVVCESELIKTYASASPGGTYMGSHGRCVHDGIEFYSAIGADLIGDRAEGDIQLINYATVEVFETPWSGDAPQQVGEVMAGEADIDLTPFDHIEFVIVRPPAD